jgi:hypothetical protein
MKKIFAITIFAMGLFGLRADETPFFQASLTPDIAIYPKTTEIHGLSLNIWGENPQQGVALGFVNGSSGDSAGFSWGLVNYCDSYTGVSWALVNVSRTSFHGWQSAWVNVAQDEFVGFQSGCSSITPKPCTVFSWVWSITLKISGGCRLDWPISP